MTSDKLQKEAREAAEAAFPPGPGRLGGKLYAGKPAKEGFRERSWFQKGFIAAAEPREKELSELRPKLADRNKRLAAAFDKHDSLCAEIASLRAKLEAVPVEEIKECAKLCRDVWPEEGIADDARTIDRWLAGLAK